VDNHDAIQPELPILGVDGAIFGRVGLFPSPSVLIDGTDMMRPDLTARG
jgi:hypothetical protein